MNELAIIFDKLGLDTSEVLAAAGTKVELPEVQARPGGRSLHRRRSLLPDSQGADARLSPQVILAGRHINDGMGKFVAEQTIKQMIAAGSTVKGARVNVLGLTFKENCNDLRNSKVVDIINELKTYGVAVFVTDPQASAEEAMEEYGVRLLEWHDLPRADALVGRRRTQGVRCPRMASIAEKLTPEAF
jgi:UDP-N-acetyl-D-galactosamine dehydrogenase